MAEMNNNRDIAVTEASLQALDQTVDSVRAEQYYRGGNGFAAAQVSELERRELRMRMVYPFSYTMGDALQGPDGDRYRTGRENGNPFFTVDDYLRLRGQREDTRFGGNLAAKAIEYTSRRERTNAVRRPAAAYACVDAVVAAPLESRDTVFFANGSAAMRVKNRSKGESRLQALRNRYMESPVALVTGHSLRPASGMIAAVSLVLFFAMLLSFPVVMKILMHRESGVLAELDSQIRTAETEIAQLEIELDRKNDRTVLEQLAVEQYGMVPLDHSDYRVMLLNPEDAIERVEKEKSGSAVFVLLKALGLRPDNENP